MKLLGEDSPVSKLQVKLEPGTPPQALRQLCTRCPGASSPAPCFLCPPQPGQAPPTPGGRPGAPSVCQRLLWAEHLSPWGWALSLPRRLRQAGSITALPGHLDVCGTVALCPSYSTRLTTPAPSLETEKGALLRAGVVSGVNPSHLMNLFTYEKGYCFVYYLSQLCGDPQRFDDFLRVSGPALDGPCPCRPCPAGPGLLSSARLRRPTWRSTGSPAWWPRICWTPF